MRLLPFVAAAVAVCLVAGDSVNQASAQGFGRGRGRSNLTGTYRLNPSVSDNSSQVADQAKERGVAIASPFFLKIPPSASNLPVLF